jgi:proliferating cell nuclear antigen PCNA
MSRLIITPKDTWDLNLELSSNEQGFITRKLNIFKHIISVISELTSELNFIISKDGLKFDTMDSKHISYIKCLFPPDFFENFNCTEDKVYGMSLKWLSKVLANTKSNMDMSMKFSSDKCLIEFADNKNNKEYELNLLELSYDPLNVPTDFESNLFTLDSKEVFEIFKEISTIENSIKICYDNNKLTFSTDGELGKLKINKEFISENESLEMSFSITQLLTISRLHTLSKHVDLNISKETPMRTKYHMDDYVIEFYIAPKLDD